MKNKKLFICMLTVLATVACAGGVACQKEPQNVTPITVNIQQENEMLNVLGEKTLSVLTENVTSDVVWSSSDESIATVKDGVVTALNVGTATITATANGVSDSCVIEVLSSEEMPVIQVSRTQISVDKNGEYTVTAALNWMGKDVTDKVDLKWELGAGAQDGIAAVTATEKGKAVIKGLSVGETEIYVSATVGDAYVNKKISVNVCDSSVWFESESMPVGDNGKFQMQMGTIDEFGNSASVDAPTVQAFRDGVAVENATYTWESADESIVKIVDGKIVAQRAGKADIYGNYEGNKVAVTVSVERSVLRLDENIVFEAYDLQPVTLSSEIFGAGEDVLLDGEVIGQFQDGVITLNANKYPQSSKELGKRELMVNTDQATYVLNANLYTMYIQTAEELNGWHQYAYANGDDGYYALANNIEFNGVYNGSRTWGNTGYAWANPDETGFKGVFDGNGYIIDGLRIEGDSNVDRRGFVTLLRAEGVIKNVAFTNAGISIYGAYVCNWGCGTIENVYVQYAAKASTGLGGFGGTFMATDSPRGMTGKMTIKNCFVDVSKTTLGNYRQSYIGSYQKYDADLGEHLNDGVYAKVNDVYVLGADKINGNEAKLSYNEFAEGSDNYKLFTTVEAMAADSAVQARIAEWDSSFWGVKNGIPTPLSVIERGDPFAVITPAESEHYTFNGGLNVYPNSDYTFTVTPKNAANADFIVTVNGQEMTDVDGVYTVENVQGDLEIKVIHGYFETKAKASVTYGDDGSITLKQTVFAHTTNGYYAYLSETYLEYMYAQGYRTLSFTMEVEGIVARQGLANYNGKNYTVGDWDNDDDPFDATYVKDITITLVGDVSGNMFFWYQSKAGSGNAIKDNEGCWMKLTNFTFSK